MELDTTWAFHSGHVFGAALFPDVHTLRKSNQINGYKEHQNKEEESARLGDENNVYFVIIFGF